MDTSDLAKRMKNYEERNRYYLQNRIPVAIRVDMRAGHTFTKGFDRPFDKVFMKSMQETAKYMCENIQGAKISYVQSDEITIILTDYDTLTTSAWFDYRIDKLCSIAASMATMAFNRFFKDNAIAWIEDYYESWNTSKRDDELCPVYLNAAEKDAMFDARCFNIPKEEVCNLIYWRQLDATRNSIQMVGQANFSHKELQNLSCNQIQDKLLTEKNINWNDFPISCKRGAACIKKKIIINLVERSEWIIDKEMPILKGENRKYVDDLIWIGE